MTLEQISQGWENVNWELRYLAETTSQRNTDMIGLACSGRIQGENKALCVPDWDKGVD